MGGYEGLRFRLQGIHPGLSLGMTSQQPLLYEHRSKLLTSCNGHNLGERPFEHSGAPINLQGCVLKL